MYCAPGIALAIRCEESVEGHICHKEIADGNNLETSAR